MTPARIRRAVGQHLATWQTGRQFNQKEVSQMLGVTASFYNRLLVGTGRLSIDLLCTISHITEMSVPELVIPPEAPVEVGRKWKTSDLIARIDNVKAMVLSMEREG